MTSCFCISQYSSCLLLQQKLLRQQRIRENIDEMINIIWNTIFLWTYLSGIMIEIRYEKVKHSLIYNESKYIRFKISNLTWTERLTIKLAPSSIMVITGKAMDIMLWSGNPTISLYQIMIMKSIWLLLYTLCYITYYMFPMPSITPENHYTNLASSMYNA